MFASESFEHTVSALLRGEPAIFPTDTVYGLGVAVGYADSPAEIFRLKHRPANKPVAWLVSGAEALNRYGMDVPLYAHRLAERFWPGPLTLIVHAGEQVPRAFTSAHGSIGMRMPDNDVALSLIKRLGVPLATSSANLSGFPATCHFSNLSPELVSGAAAALADSDDSGKSGIASTVVDCTGSQPVFIRCGSITESMINSVL